MSSSKRSSWPSHTSTSAVFSHFRKPILRFSSGIIYRVSRPDVSSDENFDLKKQEKNCFSRVILFVRGFFFFWLKTRLQSVLGSFDRNSIIFRMSTACPSGIRKSDVESAVIDQWIDLAGTLFAENDGRMHNTSNTRFHESTTVASRKLCSLVNICSKLCVESLSESWKKN